ncbi:uncharacterized protein TM35_000022190 [Trypanosoma theileri]|uniref:Uncharacterized protein n=1 Tax=Trypanosoma theileri TaxID=67003 RepID=A0A1X0P8E1_9TRYP|nr:uncharacterized protein TM35_000022190 [Trypanosoma theileri]ORC92893.1 hypothetical protein TM35_000022190 [Trypanosoma theileri]
MEGESSFISRHVPELEIVLYRSVPDEGKQPLFFDTTACLFNEYGGQIDYVGVGRTTTNNKGLSHKPHTVLVVDATTEVAHNFLEPAGGPSVIAGDSVLVNFKKIAMWSGVSVCATLFTPDISLSEVTDVYYAVRKPDALVPLAIIPVTSGDSKRNSCIAFMIRKIKLNTETGWELVRVGETLQEQDVKGVVEAMQNRGLVDPIGYKFDTSRGLDYTTESCSENSSFEDIDDDDDDDDDDDFVEVKISRADSKESLERLLVNVPRVTREGRRQYTVGRSTLNTVAESGDSSDEDEIMEDALRAVVPRYTSACPVRYEEKTYNVGSRDETLAMHYVDHREEYGLSNAESRLSRVTELPPVFSLSSAHLHRLSYGDTGIIRPAAPHELLSSMYSALCGKSSLRRRSGRSPSEARLSSSRRGRRSSSRRPKGRGRRSKSRKSRSRSTSAKRKNKGGRRKRTNASRRRKSRTSSAAKRRSSSSYAKS